MSEKETVNEIFHDMDGPASPVFYEKTIPMLKCGKCKRRQIPEDAETCPSCGSYDLIPDTPRIEEQYKAKGFE